MTVSSQNELSYLGVNASNPPNVIYSTVAPTSGVGGTGNSSTPIGTMIINTSTGASYQLVSASGSSAQGTYNPTWVALGGGAAAVATVNNLSPTAGNITLAGTANQITATSAGSTVTFSLPAAVTAPGSVTSTTTVVAGTGLTVTTGDATVTNGNAILNGAGKQLRVHGGAATDFIGQVTLVNGTATVLNTNIAATDRVFVTRSAKNASTAYGTPQITITASTNFVITACKADTTTETNDVSTFDYFIVRQV